MKMLKDFKVHRTQGVESQICHHLREVIVSGQLKCGEKLPPTEELAAMFSVATSTVQKAIVPLVREGMLIRRPKLGTFVRKREERLTAVAVYWREDYLTNHSSDFHRAVHAAIKEELDGEGVETQLWVDPRPIEQQATPWDKLCKAVEQREIQGLIVFSTDWPHLRWLSKLAVPAAYGVSANFPNKVEFGRRKLVDLSLRNLAEQGCRSVGFIGPCDTSRDFDEDGSPNKYWEFLGHFTDLASDLGLAMRSDWMLFPTPDCKLCRSAEQEQYGYEAFLKLWSMRERPEGLLVTPDTLARGVILAVREKQVRVPEELKLVLHRNESVGLHCPMPATFVVLSEREFAHGLIEQVQKQFRGERCEPITVDFTLAST